MLALATCAGAYGQNSPPHDATQQLAALADNTHWLTLLHYPIHGTQTKSYGESPIDDAEFFFAADGGANPLAEITATLAAFNRPVTNPDQHPVCKFPARWFWLHSQLALTPGPITPNDCPEFQQWMQTIKPHSITLVFASSYLNSPSSMFGHTFLRVDPADIETGSSWLSYAVNFGAELHPEDNSILYAYKGLFGGYPGFFSVIRYQQKINEYNRIENRDLWEYQLNLSPAEVTQLMQHLWELRNIDFDYFFFDENCSYRLLELLELARPDTDLTSRFALRAIPLDTVRAVEQAGMISRTVYRSSAATDLQFQIDQLSVDQQQLARALARRQRSLDDADLLALSPAVRAQVLRVAYKHLRFQQLGRERDPQHARLSLELLQQLNTLDIPEPIPQGTPAPPEAGHDSLLLGVTGGRSDGTNLLDLRIRTSYHDLADNPLGYLDGAAINIGELQLRQREQDSLQIEMFNVVDINSHAPRNLFFQPLTWRIRAGFDRVYGEQDDTLAPRVNGGAGVTYRLGQRHLVYGLGIARLEYDELLQQNWAIGAGALVGSLFYTPAGSLQLEAEYYQFSDGGERSDLKVIHNIPLGRDDALRFNYLRRKQVDTRFDEISLEFRHYL